MSSQYHPGSQPALVTERAVVLSAPESLDTVRALFAGDLDLLTVLDALAGADLVKTPDFVAVLTEADSVRILVRGGYEVTAGDWHCSGEGIFTWNEQRLTLTDDLRLRIARVGAEVAGTPLPVTAGVVLAEVVEWSPSGAEPAAGEQQTPARSTGAHASVPATAGAPERAHQPTPPGPAEVTRDPISASMPRLSGPADPVEEVEEDGRDAGEDPDAGDSNGDARSEADDKAAQQARTDATRATTGRSAPTAAAPAPAPARAAAEVAPAGVGTDDVYDAMFGRTIQGLRPQDAAVRTPEVVDDESAPAVPTSSAASPSAASLPTPSPAAPSAAGPAEPVADPGAPAAAADEDSAPADLHPETIAPPRPGDHDGRTITSARAQQLRAQRGGPDGQPGDQSLVAPPTPRATLTFSNGREITVTRPVHVGRSPRSSQASSASLPTLVVLDDRYISSTHVEFGFSEGVLTCTDVSTNGTLLTRPGHQPERLSTGVLTPLTDGCVLTLSEEHWVRVNQDQQ